VQSRLNAFTFRRTSHTVPTIGDDPELLLSNRSFSPIPSIVFLPTLFQHSAIRLIFSSVTGSTSQYRGPGMTINVSILMPS
jgi:hypothetical protein